MSHVDNGRDDACEKSLYLPLNFTVNLQILLKNMKSIKNEKRKGHWYQKSRDLSLNFVVAFY